MTEDRPFLGILLMMGFCFLVPMSDVIAKILGTRMSLGQLVTVRFAVMAIALLPLVALTSGLRSLILPRWIVGLTVARTVLHLIGTASFFAALRYLPIADALAIAFILPFLMLLAGKYVLGEEVGSRRLRACAFGFIGTLMVIQPAFSNVGWPALLPLVVAIVFTGFMLITRLIAKQADPIALQSLSGLTATAIMVPLTVVGFGFGWQEFRMELPTPGDAWLLLALGLLATIAHLLMTWSLRLAPSTTLAPIQYLEIPFATLMGWIVFRDLPNGLAAAGIVITIAAGLYILMRERALSRAANLSLERTQ